MPHLAASSNQTRNVLGLPSTGPFLGSVRIAFDTARDTGSGSSALPAKEGTRPERFSLNPRTRELCLVATRTARTI